MKRHPQAEGLEELPVPVLLDGTAPQKQCKLTAWNVVCTCLAAISGIAVLLSLRSTSVEVVLTTKQVPARTPTPLGHSAFSSNTPYIAQAGSANVLNIFEEASTEGSTSSVSDERTAIPTVAQQPAQRMAPSPTKPPKRRKHRKQKRKDDYTANGLLRMSPEPQTDVTVLPFKPVRHTSALTRECETCALPFRAPVHIVNTSVQKKVVLGEFLCNKANDRQHHVMMLICLCPSTALLSQLIHLSRTHEIHALVHHHFDKWWTFYDAAFRRAKVPYTLIRNDSSLAAVANESSYSDVFRVLPILYQSRSMCKNCLRDLVYQHNNLAFDAPCNTVLFISRQVDDRTILDEDVLMPKLTRVASKFGLPLTVYYGTESIPEMTTLFAGMRQALVGCAN
jgi:hypothetical protein